MPKSKHLIPGDGLMIDSSIDLYTANSRRVPQLQMDDDIRTPTSPLEKPRLGIEARRQLRAELFGPMQEVTTTRDTTAIATTSSTLGGRPPTLRRVNTLNPAKPSMPIDIHAAITILKELKKTATTDDLVALHRALLPEITTQQPQPEPITCYIEAIPPHNAEIRRRRSLFRPGEATRTAALEPLVPMPVAPQPPTVHGRHSHALLDPSSLTPPDHPRPFTARTATPSDLGRSYLGNYKLGSLHVTNGAASPLPMSQLKHVRNPSNTASEREDDYYTASEGSVGRKEEMFQLVRDGPVVPGQTITKPPVHLYLDKDGRTEEGDVQADPIELTRQGTIIRHIRPGFDRRHTDDTIASTGSKYSYTTSGASETASVEDPFSTPATAYSRIGCGLGGPDLRITQIQVVSTGKKVDWVEDVEPQFLEYHEVLEAATAERERSGRLRKTSPSTSQRSRSQQAIPQMPSRHPRPSQLLEVSSDGQKEQRDSGYGEIQSPAHLLGPTFEAQPIIHAGSNESPQSRGESSAMESSGAQTLHRLPAENISQAGPAIDLTPEKFESEANNHPIKCDEKYRNNSDQNNATNSFAKQKVPTATDDHTSAERRPLKLQKRRATSARALPIPIIVQRQRSISECPYLPKEVVSKHNQRLNTDPGKDYLERTYKNVTRSLSCDSFASMECFHHVEIRFPSPTPDSQINSRGRKPHRSGCGPFHPGNIFRSKSRKRITALDDTIDSVPSQPIQVVRPEVSKVAASIDSGPVDVVKLIPAQRRVPSGPRAMVPSGQYAKRWPCDNTLNDTTEQGGSELVLSRRRERGLIQDLQPSSTRPGTMQHVKVIEKSSFVPRLPSFSSQLSESVLQQSTSVSQQPLVAARGEDTKEPSLTNAPNARRVSMLDRPRGWRDDEPYQSPKSIETVLNVDSTGSPSPRSLRRKPVAQSRGQPQPHVHVRLGSPTNSALVQTLIPSAIRVVNREVRPVGAINEQLLDINAMDENSAARKLPPPNRAPPVPPTIFTSLAPPNTRTTIRKVDSSPERLPHKSLPKLNTPVHISVSILNKPLSAAPSPPTHAPLLPPKLVPTSKNEIENNMSELVMARGRHRRRTFGGMEGQWLGGNVDLESEYL